jgi:predicted nucleotidyltransferase
MNLSFTGIGYIVIELGNGSRCLVLPEDIIAVISGQTSPEELLTRMEETSVMKPSAAIVATVMSDPSSALASIWPMAAYPLMWNNGIGTTKAVEIAARCMGTNWQSRTRESETRTIKSLRDAVSKGEGMMPPTFEIKEIESRSTAYELITSNADVFAGRSSAIISPILNAIVSVLPSGVKARAIGVHGSAVYKELRNCTDVDIFLSTTDNRATIARLSSLTEPMVSETSFPIKSGHLITFSYPMIKARIELCVVGADEAQDTCYKTLFMSRVMKEPSIAHYLQTASSVLKANNMPSGRDGGLSTYPMHMLALAAMVRCGWVRFAGSWEDATLVPVVLRGEIFWKPGVMLRTMASLLADRSTVIDFTTVDSACPRIKTEYRLSSASSVMRDPSGRAKDNVLRLVRRDKINQIVAVFNHCSYCPGPCKWAERCQDKAAWTNLMAAKREGLPHMCDKAEGDAEISVSEVVGPNRVTLFICRVIREGVVDYVSLAQHHAVASIRAKVAQNETYSPYRADLTNSLTCALKMSGNVPWYVKLLKLSAPPTFALREDSITFGLCTGDLDMPEEASVVDGDMLDLLCLIIDLGRID